MIIEVGRWVRTCGQTLVKLKVDDLCGKQIIMIIYPKLRDRVRYNMRLNFFSNAFERQNEDWEFIL